MPRQTDLSFASSDAFAHWLAGRPPRWAAVLASRTVLRLLPYLSALANPPNDKLLLGVFRAALLLNVVARENKGEHRRTLLEASSRLHDGTPFAAIHPSLAAIKEIVAAIASNAPDDKVARIIFAAATVYELGPRELSSDANLLEIGRSPTQVSRYRLWPRWRPAVSYPNEATSFLRQLAKFPAMWRAWSIWYDSLAEGHLPFGLPRRIADRTEVLLADAGAAFWDEDASEINAAWLQEVGDSINAEKAASRTRATDFIVRLLDRENGPLRNAEIAEALAGAGINISKPSVDWALTNLQSDRRITRVSWGHYASNAYARESTLPFEPEEIVLQEPEPQKSAALQFLSDVEGRIALDQRAGVDRLRNDDDSRDRHSEATRHARALVSSFDPSAPGANTAADLIEDVTHYLDVLGATLATCRPSLLVARGDGLRQLLEMQNAPNRLTDLPPLADRHLLALKRLVAAHNLLVSLDPELARRDEALLGPDAAGNVVRPSEGMELLSDAVASGAATPDTEEALAVEAGTASASQSETGRAARRYSEGVKNFGRAAIASAVATARALWRARKVVGGGTAAIAVGSVVVAKWVLANEQWFTSTFANNPAMRDAVAQVVELLKSLPLT